MDAVETVEAAGAAEVGIAALRVGDEMAFGSFSDVAAVAAAAADLASASACVNLVLFVGGDWPSEVEVAAAVDGSLFLRARKMNWVDGIVEDTPVSTISVRWKV